MEPKLFLQQKFRVTQQTKVLGTKACHVCPFGPADPGSDGQVFGPQIGVRQNLFGATIEHDGASVQND